LHVRADEAHHFSHAPQNLRHDHPVKGGVGGMVEELDFLARIYDLDTMPRTDPGRRVRARVGLSAEDGPVRRRRSPLLPHCHNVKTVWCALVTDGDTEDMLIEGQRTIVNRITGEPESIALAHN
jgi:hypothetical protein